TLYNARRSGAPRKGHLGMKKSIVLKTAIPGPSSQELGRARQSAVPRGPYNITPVFMARGEGAMLEDVDGNRFIDFAGGIGVLNAGHAPKEVVRAIQQQAEKYIHSCFHVTMNEPYAPEVHRMPFSYCYRCPWGKRYPGCNIECGTFLEDFFKRYVDPTTVAALVVEPILGEGGFVMPPQEYYPILVNLCRKHDILVIADE